MKALFWKYTFVFVVLFIATFDFEYQIIPSISVYINPFFENLVYWSGITIFNLSGDFRTVISSDSVGMYIHTFNLIFISGLGAFIWHKLTKTQAGVIRAWAQTVIEYYLSLQMLLYGFNKVFKIQFYQPEPNLLFTNLGDLTPDILYWSTIGSSWSYSFIIGMIEVLVAGLLLFKKTRLLGVLIGIGVMFNVVLINFSYDISVKLYASFLLGLFLVLLAPYLKYLYASLILQKPIPLIENTPPLFPKLSINAKMGLKSLVILIFMIEGLLPFYTSNSYNDDTAKRPLFHGAYQVTDSSQSNNISWDFVFVHRGGYFISKDENNKMQDYQLEIDTIHQTLLLTRYDLNKNYVLQYEMKDESLHHIYGTIESSKVDIYLQKVDERSIPLLNSEFHWTTEH